jgi:hypothetical protein
MFHHHLDAPSLEHLARTRIIRLRVGHVRLALISDRFRCPVSEPHLSRNPPSLLLSPLVHLDKGVLNGVGFGEDRAH